MHGQETTKNLNPTINILLKVYRLIPARLHTNIICYACNSTVA